MKTINLTAIIVVVIIVASIFGGLYIFKKPTGTTISVTGNSEMKASPDQVIVYVLVQTKDMSADKAKDDNAVISDNILKGLKNLGIADKDIQTENYNINPEYDWTSGRQKLTGYSVSNNLKVIVTNFDNTGKVVDMAVDNGGLINYINFELSNDKLNEYKSQVMTKASLDAKNKAASIASGLGKRLGDLVSVSTSDYNYRPYPLYAMDSGMAESAKTVATNIQPKDLDLTATVNVVYSLK